MVASTNVELITVANFKRELEGCEERLVREVALRKGLHNKVCSGWEFHYHETGHFRRLPSAPSNSCSCVEP